MRGGSHNRGLGDDFGNSQRLDFDNGNGEWSRGNVEQDGECNGL